MTPRAPTPEDLETLFEDAFIMRDAAQVSELFESGGVLIASDTGRVCRGNRAIGRAAAELWGRGPSYVPRHRRVLQARDTALVVSAAALHVARRGPDRSWRVAICLLDPHESTTREDAWPRTQDC